MSQPAEAPTSTGNLADHLLRCWLLIALGLLIVGAALRDFHLGQEYEFLRTQVLVAEIAAGAGAAFCFGGAMHYLDRALASRTPRGAILSWYWRALFVTQKRLLMLAQLAAAALVAAAVGAFIFDQHIPGPDRSVLQPGWTPRHPSRNVARPKAPTERWVTAAAR